MKKLMTIEINNESNEAFWAMACRTKWMGNIYIHIGTVKRQLHEGNVEKVEPQNYAVLEINEVDG